MMHAKSKLRSTYRRRLVMEALEDRSLLSVAIETLPSTMLVDFPPTDASDAIGNMPVENVKFVDSGDETISLANSSVRQTATADESPNTKNPQPVDSAAVDAAAEQYTEQYTYVLRTMTVETETSTTVASDSSAKATTTSDIDLAGEPSPVDPTAADPEPVIYTFGGSTGAEAETGLVDTTDTTTRPTAQEPVIVTLDGNTSTGEDPANMEDNAPPVIQPGSPDPIIYTLGGASGIMTTSVSNASSLKPFAGLSVGRPAGTNTSASTGTSGQLNLVLQNTAGRPTLVPTSAMAALAAQAAAANHSVDQALESIGNIVTKTSKSMKPAKAAKAAKVAKPPKAPKVAKISGKKK